MKTEFSKDQFETYYPNGVQNRYWNLARNRLIENALLKYVSKQCALMDIGCGRAITVDYLLKRGFDSYGVELAHTSPIAPMNDRAYFGINSSQLPEDLRQKITVISLLDVIEHIEYPVKFLKEQLRLFPQTRFFIITVPARQELWSNHDTDVNHFKRYSINDIRQLAVEIGCDLLHSQYFFHSLYPIAFIQARILGHRSKKRVVPKGDGFLAIHQRMADFLVLESNILPGFFYGTSLLGVLSVPVS